MCSITLHKIHAKEMGLYLKGSVLSPFLNKGQTCAFFQSEGSCPVCSVFSKWGSFMGTFYQSCFRVLGTF